MKITHGIASLGRGLALAGLLLTAGGAQAQEPPDFYRNKTVQLVVPFSPGGIYDLTSRILARYMPDFIPGRPGMVVQNQPGGGGITSRVVDMHQLDAGATPEGTEHQAADAAKAVDADFHRGPAGPGQGSGRLYQNWLMNQSFLMGDLGLALCVFWITPCRPTRPGCCSRCWPIRCA
jgi:hypothetical protein